jgi:hypothetical protein
MVEHTLMRVGELTEVIQTFDPAKDGYNKRAVKEARTLLRKKALPCDGSDTQYQVPFRGKTYVQVPGDYLYVFAARDHQAIKIGHSISPEARIYALEHELKLRLEPLLLLPDKGFLEKPMHHIFWDYRIAREWFGLELTMTRFVDEIRALPFAVVVTRQELAAKFEAQKLEAARCRAAELAAAEYSPEPIAA